MTANCENVLEFVVGKKFNSYEELASSIYTYENSYRQKLCIKDSRKLESSNIKRFVSKRLKYYQIEYACIHGGGKFISKGKGLRKSSTYKMGCPVHIRLRASCDGNDLEVIKLNLMHDGHQLSEKVFEHLPQVRKLNSIEVDEVCSYLELHSNPKLVQNKIMKEHKKKINLKDINNIKYQLKKGDNDLNKAVTFLKEKCNAHVAVLHDSDNNFQAMYFSTSDMQRSMESWPEIVFIDGTYKLLNTGLTVMLLIVEDSNAFSEVVGVCLIKNEDYETFKWFLNTFKNQNLHASNHINCFMSDKDLLERDVIKEVFPNIPVYICLFHTLKTFKRNVTMEKSNITKQEQDVCLQLLEKLVYSSSEEDYANTYKIFCNSAPDCVVEYFNKNWHNIRSEWTVYNMVNGNLNNRTNNRLESLNNKIKSVIPKNSNLSEFLKHFFNWLSSHNEERNHRASKVILKRPVTVYNEGCIEKLYENFLTPYAYSYVLKQLQLGSHVTIHQEEENYVVKNKKGTIYVTLVSCQCGDFCSMMLPCKHIFALRTYLNQSLFCEEVCNKRWTKNFYLKCHRAVDQLPVDKNMFLPSLSVSVTDSKPVIMNPSEKRKKSNSITSALSNLMCISSNSAFMHKLETLKRIELLWRQGFEVTVDKVETETAKLGNKEKVIVTHKDQQPGNIEENSVFEVIQGFEQCENNIEFDMTTKSLESAAVIINENPPNQELNEISLLKSDNSFYGMQDHDYCIASENKIVQNKETPYCSTELSKIVMPHKIVKRGRTRGSDATVIGLPKRKRIKIPIKFDLKAPAEKQKQILTYILSSEVSLNQILQGEYILKKSDINDSEFSHALLDESIDLELIKDFMEYSTFVSLKTSVEQKKLNMQWNCTTCHLVLSSCKSILCDSCLKWYHFKCVGLVNMPKKRTWFCKHCYD